MIPMDDDMILTLQSAWLDYAPSRRTVIPGREFHSLSYRLNGRVALYLPQKTLYSSAGQLTFMPAGCTYATQVLEGGDMLVVHFTSSVSYPEPMVFTPADGAAFRTLFQKVLKNETAGQKFDAFSAFYEILSRLRRLQAGPVPPRMQAAAETIRQQFSDPSLSVQTLAEQARVSEVYFRREFRRCFGVPPLQYLRNTRLEYARVLLNTGLYRICDVATRCGFNSISYFSNQFRAACGLTPGEYARAARQQTDNTDSHV